MDSEYLVINKQIRIEPSDVVKCREFSLASVNTSIGHYHSRNQYDKEKITKDIETGKIGECGVQLYMRLEHCEIVNGVDYKIYPASQKRFAPDLVIRENGELVNLHVKSQSVEQMNWNGKSWTFQSGGKGSGHRDVLLDSPALSDPCYFCIVDKFGAEFAVVTIIFAARVRWLHSSRLIFDNPNKESLRETKRCLYWNRVEEYINAHETLSI